jgi:hypothetical protein
MVREPKKLSLTNRAQGPGDFVNFFAVLQRGNRRADRERLSCLPRRIQATKMTDSEMDRVTAGLSVTTPAAPLPLPTACNAGPFCSGQAVGGLPNINAAGGISKSVVSF